MYLFSLFPSLSKISYSHHSLSTLQIKRTKACLPWLVCKSDRQCFCLSVLTALERKHPPLPYFLVAIFLSLKMYKELLFKRTIGASALYFCVAVKTDNPKCLDLVYSPCRIFEYLIKVLSSAKSSIINKQLKLFFIPCFF